MQNHSNSLPDMFISTLGYHSTWTACSGDMQQVLPWYIVVAHLVCHFWKVAFEFQLSCTKRGLDEAHGTGLRARFYSRGSSKCARKWGPTTARSVSRGLLQKKSVYDFHFSMYQSQSGTWREISDREEECWTLTSESISQAVCLLFPSAIPCTPE